MPLLHGIMKDIGIKLMLAMTGRILLLDATIKLRHIRYRETCNKYLILHAL